MQIEGCKKYWQKHSKGNSLFRKCSGEPIMVYFNPHIIVYYNNIIPYIPWTTIFFSLLRFWRGQKTRIPNKQNLPPQKKRKTVEKNLVNPINTSGFRIRLACNLGSQGVDLLITTWEVVRLFLLGTWLEALINSDFSSQHKMTNKIERTSSQKGGLHPKRKVSSSKKTGLVLKGVKFLFCRCALKRIDLRDTT